MEESLEDQMCPHSASMATPMQMLDVTKKANINDKLVAINEYLKPYDTIAFNCSIKYKVLIEVVPKESKSMDNMTLIYNVMKKPRIHECTKQMIMDQLRFCSTIIKINLCNNNINDYLVLKMTEALMNHRSIQSIELRNNLVGQQGAKALSISIRYYNSLTLLNMNGNPISSLGLLYLSKAFCTVKSLETLGMRSKEYSFSRVKPLLKCIRLNTNIKSFEFF